MSYYEENDRIDVLSRITELLDSKAFYLSDETLLVTPTLTGRDIDSPWVTVKLTDKFDCYFWNDIVWRYFRKVMGNQPPIQCQKCWKVVIRPETVVQLVHLEGILESIKGKVRGCKLGCETRDYVNALYGGYIYNYSKPEGLRTLKMIREVMADYYGDEAPRAFLKRGCTEYEMQYGDPDNWHIAPGQEEAEEYIKSRFDWSKPVTEPPNDAKARTRKFWVEQACGAGDKTYLQLVDRPHHAIYKTYEEEGSGVMPVDPYKKPEEVNNADL